MGAREDWERELYGGRPSELWVERVGRSCFLGSWSGRSSAASASESEMESVYDVVRESRSRSKELPE